MDCGPAALASLLSGCGMSVSYPRLRELCQTDVDGTSIDTLETPNARDALAQLFPFPFTHMLLGADYRPLMRVSLSAFVWVIIVR